MARTDQSSHDHLTSRWHWRLASAEHRVRTWGGLVKSRGGVEQDRQAPGTPRHFRRVRIGAVALCILLAVPAAVSRAESPDTTATNLIAAVDSEDLGAAVAAVAEIDLRDQQSLRTLAAVVRIARRCEQEQRRDDAAEIYHTASAICERLVGEQADELAVEKADVIWNAAASSLTANGRHADALRWATLAAESADQASTSSRTGDTLLAIAAGALDSDDKLTAGKAYRLAVEMFSNHASRQAGPDIATARLGYAWTLVMAANDSGSPEHIQKSLDAVQKFLDHHPDHSDAPSALLLKISCQTRLDDEEGVEKTRAALLNKHPRSSATCEVVKTACGSDGELSEQLRTYLIEQHDYVLMSPLVAGDLSILQAGLMAAASAGAPDAEVAYATALSLIDEHGKVATETLHQLHTDGHDAAAQRIAMGWLTARDESQRSPDSLSARMQTKSGKLVTGGVREAACRWAGRTGQWSMLAMAAEEEPGLYERQNTEAAKQETVARGRTLHVKRLFAEALLQNGKTARSLKLWEHIVDDDGADDFATLLRLAETATEVGDIPQAKTRIAAARAAAMQSDRDGDGAGSVAMTDLLSASLEIRELRFDRGRALLEQIVRSGRAESDLRGRAQWMIGETFFMQENFHEAITAYRQVEGIGDCDQWTAAALVQAGKSFEQLGRTREATICYSALVSRFGDSPHANGARRRLAAMTTDGTSSPGTLRR
ncbi:hypothetical protein CA85_09110 [Allorhodopirellula solitaria]|uniref:Tetratricopeptide repeat protein n=2 Tax=Allorhodopirellula solitaria TaxID=2527987 RepID=A0A5C5YE47_9BACT|nr:hypothetical protein CA85_09110 [Allorhodopirellula solitaria]